MCTPPQSSRSAKEPILCVCFSYCVLTFDSPPDILTGLKSSLSEDVDVLHQDNVLQDVDVLHQDDVMQDVDVLHQDDVLQDVRRDVLHQENVLQHVDVRSGTWRHMSMVPLVAPASGDVMRTRGGIDSCLEGVSRGWRHLAARQLPLAAIVVVVERLLLVGAPGEGERAGDLARLARRLTRPRLHEGG